MTYNVLKPTEPISTMLQENVAYGLPFPVLPVLYKYVAALLGRGTSLNLRP
jgi:hypothetical protein